MSADHETVVRETPAAAPGREPFRNTRLHFAHPELIPNTDLISRSGAEPDTRARMAAGRRRLFAVDG
jgi:hypothetical protein